MRKKLRKNQLVRAFTEVLEHRRLFDVTPISFASSVSFVAGTAPDAIASADFNADGNADLAVADRATDKVNIFFGNGTGAFSAGPVLSLSAPPVAILTGDFNGDGKPDIAVATTAAVNQSTTAIVVFLNTGGGTFGLGQITTLSTTATPGEPVALAAADFNKDGHLDIAATEYDAYYSGNGVAAVMLGNGNGTFAVPTLNPVTGYVTGIAAGDFTNNGDPDIAVTSTSVNVSSGATNDGSASNTLTIFSGDGLGDMTVAGSQNIDTTGTVDNVSVANLTTDGTLGLLVGSTDGTVTVLPNIGGTFNTSAVATAAGGAGVTAVGDFNLDGIPDFVTANGGGLNSSNSVTVVPGAGSGTLSASQTLNVGSDPVAVVVGDFNNDGKPDIATANEGDTTVSILLNTTAVTRVASTTTLTSDNLSAPAGSTVTLTATVNGVSVSPLPGESIPTGTVYFYDGSTLLGSSAIVAGTDQTELQVSSLIVGDHSLHAVYGGDTAYAGDHSNVIAQVISPTATDGPDLVGTLLSSTLPTTIAPGETGTIRVQITNQGNQPGTAVIQNAAYLSLDSTVDPGSVSLDLRGGLARTKIHLKAGQSIVLTGTVTVPQTAPLASYSLLVALNTTGSLAESVPGNDTVVSATTDTVADVFGTVAGRAGVVLKVADANGTSATFRLSGPGSGAVNIGDDGTAIVLTGTTAASVLTMTTSRGSALFSATSLTDDSAIGSIRAPGLSVTDTLSLPGGVGNLTMGSFGQNTLAIGVITLGNSEPNVITIPSITNSNLNASGGIKSLTVNNWAAGTISAGWIGTIRSAHSFAAGVSLTGVGAPGGVALQSAAIPGQADGEFNITGNVGRISLGSLPNSWACNISGSVQSLSMGPGFLGTIEVGSIGTLQVRGNLSGIIDAATNIKSVSVTGNLVNAEILAGTQGVGALGSVRITGGLTTSIVAAGLTIGVPVGSSTPATVNNNGTINSISIHGPVDAGSQFAAANLPKTAVLAGKRVTTATDTQFVGVSTVVNIFT
jgi:hypothetical protein